MSNRVSIVAISGELGCTFRWCHLGGRYFLFSMCIVIEPGFGDRIQFESIQREEFPSATSRRCSRRRYSSVR